MQTALSKLDGTELSGRKIKLSEDKQNSSGRNQRRFENYMWILKADTK